MKTFALTAALALALCIPLAALSAADEGHHGAHDQAAHGAASHKLHGVVNGVNKDAGRVNITHAPVASLKWPKMKMNLKAHDAALLRDIEPGMKVDFEIEKMGNEYHLTKIQPVD